MDISQLVTIPHVLILAIGIYSIVLHEAAHAFAADYFGDPTPRMLGRCTLDPHPHIKETFLMTAILPLVTWALYDGQWVLGGGACPVSWRHLRRHRWGEFWVSFAGPLANLALAVIFALLLVLMPGPAHVDPSGNPATIAEGVLYIAFWLTLSQIVIFLFNMLPIPPMDGSHMLADVYRPLRRTFDEWGGQFGFILLILIGWPLFDRVGWPVVYQLLAFLIQLRTQLHGG